MAPHILMKFQYKHNWNQLHNPNNIWCLFENATSPVIENLSDQFSSHIIQGQIYKTIIIYKISRFICTSHDDKYEQGNKSIVSFPE